MAYTLSFISIRNGTTYTLTIGGGNGTLIGGAQPFTTKENDDEDEFTPIRTQSGYLRIVDNGSFNWKALLPSTDTDRPVVLSHVADGQTVVDWQGFMQAQNFGGVLYGDPQVREFPVQCALTVLEGTDINYQHTEIENFAYLLQRIVNTIDVVSGGTETNGVITANGTVHINEIYVGGGSDAQQWLLKRIDWQNFVEDDGDGNLSARYNLYQCLEDMCRFWGWTARTHGQDLYLTCADDASEQDYLKLTRAQLDTMAGGFAAGTVGNPFVTLAPTGDIFASVDQNDYRQRGPNKATVNVALNNINEDIIEFAPDAPFKGLGMNQTVTYPDSTAIYSTDLLTFTTDYLVANATSGLASLNLVQYRLSSEYDYSDKAKIIRIKKSYSAGTDQVVLSSTYEHCYSGMLLQLNAIIYCKGVKLADFNENNKIGNKRMYVKLGIGKTRATAKWYNPNSGTWGNSETVFKVTIGNENSILRTVNLNPYGGSTEGYREIISVGEGLTGKLFLIILGSDDVDEWQDEHQFDIEGLTIGIPSNYGIIIENGGTSMTGGRSYAGKSYYGEVDLLTTKSYTSKNQNNVRMEEDIDCIYATFGTDLNYGYGLLINQDGTFFSGYNYGGQGLLTFPEQHLADRITSYWATAKRKLEMELRYDVVGVVSPRNKMTIDQTTGHPIAISHEWRDDVLKVTILEM